MPSRTVSGLCRLFCNRTTATRPLCSSAASEGLAPSATSSAARQVGSMSGFSMRSRCARSRGSVMLKSFGIPRCQPCATRKLAILPIASTGLLIRSRRPSPSKSTACRRHEPGMNCGQPKAPA